MENSGLPSLLYHVYGVKLTDNCIFAPTLYPWPEFGTKKKELQICHLPFSNNMLSRLEELNLVHKNNLWN